MQIALPSTEELMWGHSISQSMVNHLNQKYIAALTVKTSVTSVVRRMGGKQWVTSFSQSGIKSSYAKIKSSAVSLLIL